ncbi:hypothetical protein CDCA_CDCA03G1010 [Cyanidium caldarium]|uniref:5'-deoxynucleotidase n=1 Tax=Cyanidium caldarium TaxID=2771 RepID=A0AAV9ISC0_CYACA|nr:hypothetical protein CDCA_CDCA03G1010 [Cyanidium caldarium]
MDGYGTEEGLLGFLRLVGVLKHLKRTGWVQAGVREPESVAAHMYRMALMALVLRPQDGRALRMALVHDLAECIVGDITPNCGVAKDEKRRMEEAAMRRIGELLRPHSAEAASEVMQLFEEYERGNSATARFVKGLDKLDMVLQAVEYQTQQPELELDEFFAALHAIDDPSLQRLGVAAVASRLRPSAS